MIRAQPSQLATSQLPGQGSTLPLDLTVAICTYNGADRLPAVFECLNRQVALEGIHWEILVVDNNSQDQTAEVIRAYQKSGQAGCPVHYLFESQQGAAFARRRAIEHAGSELVGFLDDDNLPATDWVARAVQFGRDYPRVGAYGSQIEGQFETPPPDDFCRIQSFFALTQRGSIPHPYSKWGRVLPPSAGLVVRRSVWQAYVPENCILTGRFDNQMLTGEDLEALSYIQLSPWEIWHNPAMKLHHVIPSWRLSRDYLIPFFKGVGLGRHVTRMLSVHPWQRPLVFPLYFMNDMRKILWHLVVYQTQIQQDLIAACEFQLFISSLMSPFYIWGKLLLARKNNA